MNSPLVSIVLPCFNSGDTLCEAIESISSQTYTDWELIFFDDGSTDNSVEIARRASDKDSRVCVLRSEHVGIVEALRIGCDTARGEYIARMDADDIAIPARLERQVALMESDENIALCGTHIRTIGSDVGLGRLRYEEWLNSHVSHDDFVRELFIECPIAHPTFMFRKSDYDDVGGYVDSNWAEDYDLCMRFFMAGKKFGNVPEVLMEWREGPERLSMNDARYSLENFRSVKRHYLFQTYLADSIKFFQWGAGEVGKLWLREWGIRRPVAVVDINPRKIGKTIHDVEVISPEGLPGPGEAFIVVAVGAHGAREDIRDWMGDHGYRELIDYLFLA